MSRIHDALTKAQPEKSASVIPEFVRGIESAAPTGSQHNGSNTPLPESMKLSALSCSAGDYGPEEAHKLLLERCTKHQWKPDRKIMLLFDRRNPVVGLEEFRTLRSRLDKVRQKAPLQILLVTSPLPQEGKTIIATNLAQVIVRHHERRVLLVDADLRSSRMHLSLGAPSEPGLSDYLCGAADELSIIQRGQSDNLFFIPGGRSVPNPSELIGNGRLKLLLQSLAPLFDWIILDSPPVIPVSDAKLLADGCDGALMVIQAGVTPSDLAQRACREFQDKKLVGVILNRVDAGLVYRSALYRKKAAPTKMAKR